MKKLIILLTILISSGCTFSPDKKQDVSKESISLYTQEISTRSLEDAILALKRSLDFSGFDIEMISQSSITTKFKEVSTPQDCDCGKLSVNPITDLANAKLTIDVFPKPKVDNEFVVKIKNQCIAHVEKTQCKSGNRIEKALVDNAQKYFYK